MIKFNYAIAVENTWDPHDRPNHLCGFKYLPDCVDYYTKNKLKFILIHETIVAQGSNWFVTDCGTKVSIVTVN